MHPRTFLGIAVVIVCGFAAFWFGAYPALRAAIHGQPDAAPRQQAPMKFVSSCSAAAENDAGVHVAGIEHYAIKAEKVMPAPPETPSFQQLARYGAAKVYEFRYGTPAPGCVTTRYMVTAAFYRR